MATIYTNEVTLTVNSIGPTGPTIDTQPQNTTVDENTTASFSVAATASDGGGALSYTWFRNASPVGTNSPNYSYTAVEGDDGDAVFVIVSDDNGDTVSDTATLTVTARHTAAGYDSR